MGILTASRPTISALPAWLAIGVSDGSTLYSSRTAKGRAWRSGFALLLASAIAAEGQKPKVETFAVEDGLPSSVILDLAQDASGRLWILSRSGVTVYDGRRFESFTAADGLPGVMGALDVDAEGRVWAVARQSAQVFRFEDGHWRMTAQPPGATGSTGWAVGLVVTPEDGRWRLTVATTTRGVWSWDGEVWASSGRRVGLVSDLARFGREIAVATQAGLCRLAESELDCAAREIDPLLAEPVFALHPASGRGTPRLWVLGADWLGYVEGSRFHLVAEGSEVGGEHYTTMHDVTADATGGVYFGSPARLSFLDTTDPRPRGLGVREGLAADGVSALLTDREANVWVGSLRGLSKIESLRFLSYDRAQGLLEDEVSALAELSPGRLLLGHNTGLTFLDGKRTETIDFDPPTAEPFQVHRILDIAEDRDGTVWLAAQDLGLVRLRQRDGWDVESGPEVSPAAQVTTVEIDTDGTLWVAGPDRLFALRDSAFAEVEVDLGDARVGFFRWLHAGADGHLYLATRNSLLWRDAGGWHLARKPDGAPADVYSVLVDSAGTVWAGTGDGLHELRGAALTEARRGALAIASPIYFILEDAGRRLWFGTDDGVRVWDGQQLRHLTLRHGLAGRETNRGAGLVDHQGRVWIGTDQGLSMYQEQHDRRTTAPPSVEIRRLKVNGADRPLEEDLALDHHENTLELAVTTIAFSRQEAVLYRYRLEGFDDTWQGRAPLSGDEIRYTNLPPGTYRFRIAAGWPEGPWSPEAVSPRIVIVPPLWRRPWFVAVVAIVVIGLSATAHGLRLRAVRVRNAELESLNAELREHLSERQAAERKRRLVEIERERLIGELETRNAELERYTYTVSHDLKTPLVTIQGFVGLLEKDTASGDAERVERDVSEIKGAARKMGRLLHELLELSRVGWVVNPPEEVALGELAREAAAVAVPPSRQDALTIDISAELPVVYGDRVRLLEVMQNLIENACKYMGGQPAPKVEIGVRKVNGEAVVYVADNGEGIEPRYHEKVFGLFERLDSKTDGTGVGLALARRIVESHGGRIWIESEGRGRGATFYFTLPEPP